MIKIDELRHTLVYMRACAILVCFFALTAAFAEECFLLVDAEDDSIVMQVGEEFRFHEPLTPCSTFKIPLSLMGYDAGILEDETKPKWPYQGEKAIIKAWKAPQTPASWMKLSVVWFSQRLTPQIGMEKIEQYLAGFDYGNQDMRGDPDKNDGLTQAWLNSSLKISMFQQIAFLKKLINEELPVSAHAHRMTKNLLIDEALNTGWTLFGKTGTGHELRPDGSIDKKWLVWYVGWFTKASKTYIFALTLRNADRFPDKVRRQAIVKQHLREAGIEID